MPQVSRIHAALAFTPEPLVPCNNDLLAGNIIDDGTRLWLIDYEYSGNNEASFELGNIWSESTLPEESLDALVNAYWQRHDPAKVARARLWALMSKYGWTLWASIQQSGSAIEFDYWSWGMEKYDRAVAEFDSPRFEGWLDAAAGR
jgi:thiamine kinase-like enzyme